MAWNIDEMKRELERKVLRIGDTEIDVTGKTADEVKKLIVEECSKLGWSRVEVRVDGEPVPPERFAEKFATARVIEVVKKDIAGSY